MKRPAWKRCYHCQLLKTPENVHLFHKNGTDSYCKACRKVLAHVYFLRKREQVLAGNHAYQKNNRSKMREIAAAWREKNPEKVLEYDRKWKADNKELMRQRERERYDSAQAKEKNAKYRKEHPEEFAAAKRRWNQENPEKVAAHNAAGRARRKNAPISDFTGDEWEFLKEELYHHCCAYCGQPADPIAKDHVISLNSGGNHTMSNILPSCTSCNSKKNDDKFIVPYLLRCADGIERPIDPFMYYTKIN